MKVAGVFLLLSLALCFYQGESNILLRSYFLSLLKLPGLPHGEGECGKRPAGAGTLLWPWAGNAAMYCMY